MLAGEVRHLRNLRFRHLIGINPADSDPFLMNVHHDAIGFIVPLVEKALQYVNDEIHRCIIVIEKQHLVEAGPLGLGFGLGDDPATQIPVIVPIALL